MGKNLFYYAPGEEISKISWPKREWPNFTNQLVDSSNRLWLDAVGLYNDGEWELLFPHPIIYFLRSKILSPYGSPSANIIMESSDGRLWFYRAYESPKYPQGTAWYDPNTGKGCWFTTNIFTNIAEDGNQNLWLILDGQLYRSNIGS